MVAARVSAVCEIPRGGWGRGAGGVPALTPWQRGLVPGRCGASRGAHRAYGRCVFAVFAVGAVVVCIGFMFSLSRRVCEGCALAVCLRLFRLRGCGDQVSPSFAAAVAAAWCACAVQRVALLEHDCLGCHGAGDVAGARALALLCSVGAACSSAGQPHAAADPRPAGASTLCSQTRQGDALATGARRFFFPRLRHRSLSLSLRLPRGGPFLPLPASGATRGSAAAKGGSQHPCGRVACRGAAIERLPKGASNNQTHARARRRQRWQRWIRPPPRCCAAALFSATGVAAPRRQRAASPPAVRQ